jgi:hypothetical protein
VKFQLVTCYTGSYADLGAYSTGRFKNYAERHGYLVAVYTDIIDPALSVVWNKVLMMRQALHRAEWTFWLDADIAIVDESVCLSRLLMPGKDLIISQDINGLCCGMFGLRNCEWSRQLLDTWLFLGDVPLQEKKEQDTLNRLMVFQNVLSRTGYIAEEVVMNRRSRFTERRPLMFHYWAHDSSVNWVLRMMRRIEAGEWSREVTSPL